MISVLENNRATTAINSKFVHNVSDLFACKECCILKTQGTHCRPVPRASLCLIRPTHLVDDSFGGFVSHIEESMLYFHNPGFRLFGENHYTISMAHHPMMFVYKTISSSSSNLN